jgi:hypothetical protein
MSAQIAFTDLTQRPPRSFRVRLGNFVILARMLDKGRATLAGKNGEYEFGSTMDQYFCQFAGVESGVLLKELEGGKGDGEILGWIRVNSKTNRAPWEIDAWSSFMEKRGPDSDHETLEFFMDYLGSSSRTREDVKTWFECIELDDFVSFGGKA